MDAQHRTPRRSPRNLNVPSIGAEEVNAANDGSSFSLRIFDNQSVGQPDCEVDANNMHVKKKDFRSRKKAASTRKRVVIASSSAKAVDSDDDFEDLPPQFQSKKAKTIADPPAMEKNAKTRNRLCKDVVLPKSQYLKAIVTNFAKDNTTIGAQQKGISIKESHKSSATNIKLLCCHFNTQGEFLETPGHDRKVLIWELGNNNLSSIEGHTQDITDVRFRPNSKVFATSSLDKTVKIWDTAEPNKTYQNLAGHDGQVMSIDYHPTMVDLLSSCDHNNEIRLWDVNMCDCKLILRGGSRHVRFQPHLGKLLASSTENIINIFDIETKNIQKQIQRHVKNIRSICWDVSGNYLPSVSEDSARIWSISEGRCIFKLFSLENKFQSCIFHPRYCLMLVIDSNKMLEYWNPILQGNMTSSYSAHDGIISSLVVSLWVMTNGSRYGHDVSL